ncbi:glycoside hydrolase family 88 protein [Paenibacillus lignilyticus]|uniref:Glycoside hydrolase family 88 protein n=1 Tax=Paenibacillus lignilyticus TaxID=1172615 RepID=A0ABS5CBX9_9BACL|nr:glycoside hydrolase family 88 protein [Paenibacillus lignilyticus]MBP3961848.1 glycoside hydrolase family 88 protein [Paenibacillus lignilyticus]MBP3963481.1 glycoside hydrolase family 88 protein [Paenibacillus lignilyticus]
MRQHLEHAKFFILEKTKKNASSFGDRLPTSTEGGKYKFADDGFWVGGFWSGLNWLCYEMSEEESFAVAAQASNWRLTKRLYEKPDTLDHDTGFLYLPTFVAHYKLTGDSSSRQIALDAADRLKERFNDKGKFIQAWNVWVKGEAFSEENRGRIIIDCMYNLPLLFWATEETNDEAYRNVAVAHADTCAKTIIRSDYTAFHTYVFDPDSGEPKYGKTFQGYSDDSCWSRGLTWAIGGYAYAYKYTGNTKYLEIARKTAEAYMSRVEQDFIPLWDFSVPNRSEALRDTSAAAISAASLLELAEHADSEDEKQRYTNFAIQTLLNLYETYSTRFEPENEGLLNEGCGHHPAGVDLNCSLIYGDYYFAEAIARLQANGNTKGYW